MSQFDPQATLGCVTERAHRALLAGLKILLNSRCGCANIGSSLDHTTIGVIKMGENTSKQKGSDEAIGDEAGADDETEETSSSKTLGKADSQQKPFSIWQFLKDAKELITIILFFAAGIVWLYAAFATKHYVGGVKCLLGATIERIDNQADSKQRQAEIVELNVELKKLEGAGLPAAEFIDRSEALKEKIDVARTKKQLAEEVVKKASLRVQNGECAE